MAKCSSCGAEILWVKSTNYKAMPLDSKFENRFVLTDQGEYEGKPLIVASSVKTYVSHFSTCPNATQHRKNRGTNAQDSRQPKPTS